MQFADFRQWLILVSSGVITTTFAGCAKTEPPISEERFSGQVVALLAGKDAVVVEAGKLTDFAWKRLCFERDDRLLLKFDREGETFVLPLPYEEYFVDEAHVPGSLQDSCVTPSDRILIKKKYPGAHGPVEFQKTAHGS
ncbi:hypothetical protein [Xanthomonas arboricola]|uniref:hypothetical protein n=1 Tax=Xanthomonas arboricola TaxID=56448 RepID=UPI0004DA689C|nr:hypothetical protein [Xanthomonas arboricola]KER79754.1 hypothetical protein IA64_19930 [Xanthomonas arboricola pv. celebensis]